MRSRFPMKPARSCEPSPLRRLGYACPALGIEIGPGNSHRLNPSVPTVGARMPMANLRRLQRMTRRRKVAFSHWLHAMMSNCVSRRGFEEDAREHLPRNPSLTNKSAKWFTLLGSYEECSIDRRERIVRPQLAETSALIGSGFGKSDANKANKLRS